MIKDNGIDNALLPSSVLVEEKSELSHSKIILPFLCITLSEPSMVSSLPQICQRPITALVAEQDLEASWCCNCKTVPVLHTRR